jgi:RNA polymerase sigma-70 factor (ECF subfamily)
MADTAAIDPNAGGDAVELAYRRYWTELCLHIRKTFGSGPPEPEEVAQGAFARFAALTQPRAVENPRAFLYRCAHNIVMDHRRRDAVRLRLSAQAALLGPGDEAATLDGERVLSAKERLAIVEAAVRAMEAKRRKVLIMHAIHELNYSQIARRMGLSPTRVTQLFAEAVALCEAALRAADETGGGEA